MAQDRLTLEDVIDLEVQLEADRALDANALRTRDRAIGLSTQAGAASTDRARQLRAWLDALRAADRGRTWPGELVARGARLLAAFLIVAGLIAGSGTARVLLHYDGVRPVNVLPVLGVLVLLQIGLLLLVLLSVSLAGAVPGLARQLPLLGDVRTILRVLSGWLASRGRQAGGSAAPWVASLHRLRARSRLHAKIELWWLTLIAQSFGIAFNVGALALLVVLPIVLKYSFCWSTTLSVGPDTLHRMTTVLSWPWSALVPQAVPSGSLIGATQFDILTREYAGGARPSSSAWWPFLVAAVVGYGLLPRLLLATSAALQLRRALAALPLDTPEVEALLRRLSLPLVETRAQEPPPPAGSPVASGRVPAAQAATAPSACAVLAWRDLPLDREALDRWLHAQLGWSARQYGTAGGADFEAERRAIEAAAATGLPLVVVAEAWEPPDKAVRRFLKALRAAAGPRTKLAVVLLGAASAQPNAEVARDLQTWSAQLAALEDPYLSVESMGAP